MKKAELTSGGQMKKFFSVDPARSVSVASAIVVLLAKKPDHARIARLALAGAESSYLLADSADQALQMIVDSASVALLAISPEQTGESAQTLLRAVRDMRARGRLMRVLIGCDPASTEKTQQALSLAAEDDSIFVVSPERFFASIKAAVNLGLSQHDEVSSPPAAATDPVAADKVRTGVLQLRWQLEKLATQLDQLTFGSLVQQALQAEAPDQSAFSRQRQLEVLRLIRELDAVHRQMLEPYAEPQPAWNMLAELYECTLLNNNVSITSLCLAADVPVTTALRKIETLIEAGYIERAADVADRRRINAVLTESGAMLVLGVLSAYERVLKPYLA